MSGPIIKLNLKSELSGIYSWNISTGSSDAQTWSFLSMAKQYQHNLGFVMNFRESLAEWKQSWACALSWCIVLGCFHNYLLFDIYKSITMMLLIIWLNRP